MQKSNNQKQLIQENHATHDLPQDFLMHLIYSKAKTRVGLYGQKSVNIVDGSGSVIGSGVADGGEVVEVPVSLVGSSDVVQPHMTVVVDSSVVVGSVVVECSVSGSDDRKQQKVF